MSRSALTAVLLFMLTVPVAVLVVLLPILIEMGSLRLFAWTDLKLQSCGSMLPECVYWFEPPSLAPCNTLFFFLNHVFIHFVLLVVLGFELRALFLPGKYHLSHTSSL
jgi:hypothetical protein